MTLKLKEKTDNGIVIRVPVKFSRLGGRKRIISPDRDAAPKIELEPDDTILKALLRGHKWHRVLESGKVSSITKLAVQENINQSYLARVIRLTLLSPDIKRAILEGRQPKALRLIDMLKPFPMLWDDQKKWFGFNV